MLMNTDYKNSIRGTRLCSSGSIETLGALDSTSSSQAQPTDDAHQSVSTASVPALIVQDTDSHPHRGSSINIAKVRESQCVPLASAGGESASSTLTSADSLRSNASCRSNASGLSRSPSYETALDKDEPIRMDSPVNLSPATEALARAVIMSPTLGIGSP